MSGAIRILIVDDDVVDRRMLRRMLTGSMPDAAIIEADTAAVGLHSLAGQSFDCVLLDYRLPDMDGVDFLRQLDRSGGEEAPPVVMLTGNGDEAVAVTALKSGASDYLSKDGIAADGLTTAVQGAIDEAQRQRREAESSRVLREMALVDSLTQIGNRNMFDMRFDHALMRARRQDECVGLLLLDLNDFKQLNDRYGHSFGDAILCEVGRRMQQTIRETDTAIRFGGDEFVVIMDTGVSAAGMHILEKRLFDAITAPISIDEHSVSVGVSLGTAMYPDDGADKRCLLEVADAAMYADKARASDPGDPALTQWAVASR